MKNILSVVVLFFATSTYANPIKIGTKLGLNLLEQRGMPSQSVDPCTLSSVGRIKIPVYPTHKDSPNWTYAFQWFNKAGPSAPTIVYLPGGPGHGYIADYKNNAQLQNYLYKVRGAPQVANFLFIDPRAVGCNTADSSTIPDDSLTTENLSYDVLAVIQSLKITNYYLYGVSYGSQFATVAASIAERDGLPRPRGIIIGGVIGRGYEGFPGSVSYGYIDQWKKLKAQLPAKSIQRLSVDSPLGIDNKVWAIYIIAQMARGKILFSDGAYFPLKKTLMMLSSDNPAILDQVKKIVTAPLPPDPPFPTFSVRLFSVLDCAEISDHETGNIFYRGDLYDDPKSNSCEGRSLSRPYFPEQWPVHVPIYYFQGSNDPIESVPMHIVYHVRHETTAPRFVTMVPDSAHNGPGIMFYDCQEGIWNGIFHEGQGLAAALTRCTMPSQFKYFAPGS